MKFSVTLHDLTAAEAATVVNAFGGPSPLGNGGALPSSAPAHSPAPPPLTAPSAGAPPPTNSAPGGVPQTAPAAPPPPPPPVQTQAGSDPAQVKAMAAMQAYAQTWKAAGVKHVLGLCKLAKIVDATPEQLAWLTTAFESMQDPKTLG